MGAPAAAAASLKPTITKDVDANGDAVFRQHGERSQDGHLTRGRSRYRLTIFGGTAPGPLGAFHSIVAISDSTNERHR